MPTAVDLTPFGFTPTESQVYGALLRLGPSTGYAVAHATRVARANTYGALESARPSTSASRATYPTRQGPSSREAPPPTRPRFCSSTTARQSSRAGPGTQWRRSGARIPRSSRWCGWRYGVPREPVGLVLACLLGCGGRVPFTHHPGSEPISRGHRLHRPAPHDRWHDGALHRRGARYSRRLHSRARRVHVRVAQEPRTRRRGRVPRDCLR